MREIWIQLRWALPLWAVGLLTNWMPDNRVVVRLRGFLAAPFIAQCGRGFQLGAQVTLLNSHRMSLGDNVYIARGTWLNALGGMTVEDEVVIAPYVVISTLQHVFANGSVRFGGSIARPVRIGRGTWIAAHASVKCGVAIGPGCLVAANAAVGQDIPSGMVAGGVPARVVAPNRDGEAEFFKRSDIL